MRLNVISALAGNPAMIAKAEVVAANRKIIGANPRAGVSIRTSNGVAYCRLRDKMTTVL
jgi:hypothetical protein